MTYSTFIAKLKQIYWKDCNSNRFAFCVWCKNQGYKLEFTLGFIHKLEKGTI